MDFDFNPKKIIYNPSDYQLRNLAMEQGGTITQFGNLAVISKVRNRSAKFTEVILRDLNDTERNLIKDAFEYIKKPTTYVIAAPPPADNPYMTTLWWIRNEAKISNESAKTEKFPSGFTIEKFNLTPEEQKIQHDKNIELGIHFR